MVLSGTATAAFENGEVHELRAGELFYIPPAPHDSWVVGDEPYVSLHFLGAEKYAKAEGGSEGGGGRSAESAPAASRPAQGTRGLLTTSTLPKSALRFSRKEPATGRRVPFTPG